MFTFQNREDILWHAKNKEMGFRVCRSDLFRLRFSLCCTSRSNYESGAERADA